MCQADSMIGRSTIDAIYINRQLCCAGDLWRWCFLLLGSHQDDDRLIRGLTFDWYDAVAGKRWTFCSLVVYIRERIYRSVKMKVIILAYIRIVCWDCRYWIFNVIIYCFLRLICANFAINYNWTVVFSLHPLLYPIPLFFSIPASIFTKQVYTHSRFLYKSIALSRIPLNFFLAQSANY